MRKKRKIALAAIAVMAVLLICTGLYTSLVKFGSINVARILYATASVSAGEKDFVVVKDNGRAGKAEGKSGFAVPNKVIIAANNCSVYDYAKDEGYKVTDQMGSSFCLEKDGKAEKLYLSGGTEYFSVWQID